MRASVVRRPSEDLSIRRAWNNRVEGDVEGVRVPVLGLEDLRANKLATDREKDRADVKGLEGKS